MGARYGVFRESDALLIRRVVRAALSDGGSTIGQRFAPVDDLPPVTIDLAGVIHGPFTGSGRYVVADLSAGTCTQQSVGTTRPSVPPQSEVWIDLAQTVGRVYLPRVG